MDFLLIIAYLILLFIRPQDWITPFNLIPTYMIVICSGIIVAMLKAVQNTVSIPQTKFLVIYLVFIYTSNILNGDASFGSEMFSKYAKIMAPYIVFLYIVNTPIRLKLTLQTIVVCSFLLSFHAIQQARTGVGWAGVPVHPLYEETRVVWLNVWDGPNVFALVFLCGIAICLESIVGKTSIMWKIVLIIMSCFSAVGLVLTNSRGGILALVAVMGSLFVMKGMHKKVTNIVIAVILLGGVFVFSPSRMSDVNTEESSAHQRIWAWEQGLDIFRESPLFGVGKGKFARYSDEGLVAHNMYIQILAEMGVFGLLVYFFAFYICFKLIIVVSRQTCTNENHLLIVSSSRALIYVMVGLSAVNFFISFDGDLMYLLLGLCSSVAIIGETYFEDFSFKIVKADYLLLIGIFVFFIILMYAIVRSSG